MLLVACRSFQRASLRALACRKSNLDIEALHGVVHAGNNDSLANTFEANRL